MENRGARRYSGLLTNTLNLNKKMMLLTDSHLHRLSALQWPEFSQRLIPWVNVLFVLLLAYSLAGISWRLWPLPQDARLLVTTTHTQGFTATKASGLDSVAALHLLGEASVVESAPVAAVIDAPETRLSLTLKGIVAVSAAAEGRALIAEGSAEEKVYKVGDALSGGAVLHEVLSDKVILKRGGRFETLTLPRERAIQTDSISPAKTSPSARPNPSRANAGGSVNQQLRTLRDSIAANPQEAFSLIQAQPVMEGGAIKGYRVNPGKQRRLFHGTGLRAGDVVTSVNGIALSDAAQMASLFEQFKTADSFDLLVERGGRQTSLTVNLGK